MGFPGSASGKEPACQCRRHEIPVQSLGWEDPLEKGMATHSNVLAWRIPWTVEPGGLKSVDSQRVGHNWTDLIHTHTHTHTHTRVSISPSSLFSLWMLVYPGLHFGASCLCLHIILEITYGMRVLISLATSNLFRPFHSVKWNTGLLAVSAKILSYSTFYLGNYIQIFGKIISRCWAAHYYFHCSYLGQGQWYVIPTFIACLPASTVNSLQLF